MSYKEVVLIFVDIQCRFIDYRSYYFAMFQYSKIKCWYSNYLEFECIAKLYILLKELLLILYISLLFKVNTIFTNIYALIPAVNSRPYLF